ncbi:MAG: tetratricopeptide repeat protein, partial [Methylocystis sp.]
MSVKIFLSAVSKEFGLYRDALRRELNCPHLVEIVIQEDFKELGVKTLDKLDVLIAGCDAVIHLVGGMTGDPPSETERLSLLRDNLELPQRLPELGKALSAGEAISYTQWEAWLADHRRKPLVVAVAAEALASGTPESKAAQARHLERLKASGHFPDRPFTSVEDLAYLLSKSQIVIKLLAKARAEKMLEAPPRRPRNLPFASLGPLFKGREEIMAELHAALKSVSGVAVAGKALHGLGGVGKTRLAIEYAHAHAAEYSALLFLNAESSSSLDRSLAALAGPEVLDLPEKDAAADSVKISAALKWLDEHPVWLLILDNADDSEAVAAVAKLLARLKGGHALVTGRATKFPAALKKFELGVLAEDAAVAFLLERTDGARVSRPDDAEQARTLARELGGLALALEQAGAYVANEQTSFAAYLKLWREAREEALEWFDATLSQYHADRPNERGLATTWEVSVKKLGPDGLRLLERLAFLAPEPLPNFLLDVAAPEAPQDFDAHKGRSDLLGFSLISKAEIETAKTTTEAFVTHRLVQDFARRRMQEPHRRERLREALGWVDAAFVGQADDVRSWPRLDPLAPHALAAAQAGDDGGIPEPTARLYGQLDELFDAKARYAEAERCSRRALAIIERSCGPDDPKLAIRLNNLAELLRKTNRLAEAEPLYRRALSIDEASLGPDHPDVARDLNNLAVLLKATNRLAEAEPLYRRALSIDEASLGPDHPNVAIRLNNLAELLRETNRLAEAEPVYRRALTIDEANYGPDHPKVAIRLNNLAELLRATKRLAEAEPLYRRALAIWETSLGPDHPNAASAVNNLALVLHATNRLAEAEPLYRQALSIDEASFGPDHPKVAIRLNNLATLLRATNRMRQAEPLSRRAVEILLAFTAQTGHRHPQLHLFLDSHFLILRDAGRSTEGAQGEIAALLEEHGVALD